MLSHALFASGYFLPFCTSLLAKLTTPPLGFGLSRGNVAYRTTKVQIREAFFGYYLLLWRAPLITTLNSLFDVLIKVIIISLSETRCKISHGAHL